MTKYNIFNEGIKDLPLQARIKHHIFIFIMKIVLEWDCFIFNRKIKKAIRILEKVK